MFSKKANLKAWSTPNRVQTTTPKIRVYLLTRQTSRGTGEGANKATDTKPQELGSSSD